MALAWIDGDWTVATATDKPTFSCPIPGVNTPYILTQPFVQMLSDWTAKPLDSPHPDYATFFLTEESERIPLGGGVVKWTRTYCAVPADHDEYESVVYPFIGTITSLGGSAYASSELRQKSCACRVAHHYVKTSTPGSTSSIPKILAMQYVNQATVGGTTYGGITTPVTQLHLAAAANTWPTAEAYQGAVDDAVANAFSATVTSIVVFTLTASGHVAGVIDTSTTVLGGQIPIKDSELTRWRGNIWLRRTRYVLAQ